MRNLQLCGIPLRFSVRRFGAATYCASLRTLSSIQICKLILRILNLLLKRFATTTPVAVLIVLPAAMRVRSRSRFSSRVCGD